MTSNSAMLSYAVAYARRFGWKVFPLIPRTKHPIYDGGFLGASSDEAQLRAWWTRTPDANIGLACGMSDVAVIDLDGVAAMELWNLIVDSTGMPFVQCAVAASASGMGNHLVYAQSGAQRVRNTTSKIGKGIDTRGDGGYIVLAPSIITYRGEDAAKRGLEDGYTGCYEWIEGAHPSNGYWEFPKAILEILKEKDTPAPVGDFKPPKDALMMLQKTYEKVSNAQPDTRNTTLYRASFFLSHFETAQGERLNLSDVRETLLYAGLRCGLPRQEVERTVESGIRGKR